MAKKAEQALPPITPFAQTLLEHFYAGYQCLYITTTEESRAEDEVQLALQHVNKARRERLQKNTYENEQQKKKDEVLAEFVTWDLFQGFNLPLDERTAANMRDPRKALAAVSDTDSVLPQDAVIIFRDLDDLTKDPQVRRTIRSLTEANLCNNTYHFRPVIIISPKSNSEDKLKQHVTSIDFSLPDDSAIRELISHAKYLSQQHQAAEDTDAAAVPKIVQCLRGMTATEITNCLIRCYVRHNNFSEAILPDIKAEKATIIRKSEVLTYVPEDTITAVEHIAGFDNMLAWLNRRKAAYTEEAKQYKIDYPRGVVLLGPAGSGKSVAAKMFGKVLDLPVYILDVASLFGSLVGESEARTRDVLRQLEAQGGCVLVMDEADKAFANVADSRGDSGVTQRVFGTILTWLAENQSSTFCIMTLNRIDGLPPELTRPGRFDAIFYTELPDASERAHIIAIHLQKRNVPLERLHLTDGDWTELAKVTDGFVGSELEEVVREARYMSMTARGNGDPTFAELHTAAKSIKPMSKRDSTQFDRIREFCKNGAKPVSLRSRLLDTQPAQRAVASN